jgi:regulatory protein
VRARPPLSLKARAISWLAQREHSRVELRRKLLRRARLDAAADGATPGPYAASADADMPPIEAEVDALLDWLEAHNYLSPARFAESRVHVRSARYGNLRIHQELARHAVELDDDAAVALRVTELERARAVWARKFGTSPPGDAAARARQMRFLAGRGFSADVIRRVVRDADAF